MVMSQGGTALPYQECTRELFAKEKLPHFRK